MKKFILPAFVTVFLALLLYLGIQLYSAFFVPQVLMEKDVTWVNDNGGVLEIDEDGAVEGELPLADGTTVEFDFVWNEQSGTAFADDDLEETLFTTGLRLRGTNLILEIEEDQVGLSRDSYLFHRVG